MQLDGKVALVTGGGRGIGRAIALAFAAEGADVGVLARSREQLEEVAGAVGALGRPCLPLACDVRDWNEVQRAVAALVQRFKHLDLVVNNAGGGTERRPVGEDDPQLWKEVIEVNLLGTYHVTRAAVPHLRARGGGQIINVGSGMGHQSRSGNSSYNAAKAGVWMLTRCLARELWEARIAVNELIPGPVATQLTADVFQPGRPHPSIPSETVKSPEDVVPLALFLATQTPQGPTGQSFSLARRPLDG